VTPPTSRDDQKLSVAVAALDFVEPGGVIGVGSGTTSWAFVEALGERRPRVAGAVAASDQTAIRLKAVGIPVLDLSDGLELSVYVDGADLIDMTGRAIKGGGAAHTREKLVAQQAEHWVCIVDASKVVPRLEGHAIPLEVEPDAIDAVAAAVSVLGGTVAVREGSLTDAGNPVLDAEGLPFNDLEALEDALDAIPGVVGNGLFARRRADVILVGRAGGGVGRIAPAQFL